VSDPESPNSLTKTGCDTTTIGSDTGGTTLTCSATSAGGTDSKSVTIKRDATDPTVTADAERGPGHNGWYNAPFTVSFSGTDTTSGNVSCDASVTYSGPDTDAHSISGSCTDEAGNSASDTFDFKYDQGKPSVALNGFNTGSWTLQRVQVNCTGFNPIGSTRESVPSNTPSTVFRYDSKADQYVYNADFSNKPAGTCWKVTVTLDDGTTQLSSAIFKLQK